MKEYKNTRQLDRLKERYEHHKTEQEYPFIITLEDWLKEDEAADIGDRAYMYIISTFAAWALDQEEEGRAYGVQRLSDPEEA